ncbi:MAG: hypothetical protein II808_02085 [Clostridia bacterium]|nr:hypothetical protein [Clostridia bacterium]
MPVEIKYKVSDLAKDFNLKPKDISDILAKYMTAPKNSAASLGEDEISVVFECLTQQHAIASFEEYFKEMHEKADRRRE